MFVPRGFGEVCYSLSRFSFWEKKSSAVEFSKPVASVSTDLGIGAEHLNECRPISPSMDLALSYAAESSMTCLGLWFIGVSEKVP